MAPGLLIDQAASNGGSFQHRQRPTVYLVDEYHPVAVEHAKKLFNVIEPTDADAHRWREYAEYILVKGSEISASDVAAAKKLRAIGKQGVGVDKIDTQACIDAGIAVITTPGVNAEAVAELALALTMAVARELGSIQVRQSQGQIIHKQTCSGLLLSGKTLGLVGMGNIGKRVAQMFRGAFGSAVLAYDPFLPADAWDDLSHTRVATAAEVIREADVLSLHVPLNESTRDMITYKELSTMKPQAVLINAARGGIVNESDLCRALTEGLIWGAGVDCHEEEPPTRERYASLWSHPRVVSTPHIGAATQQTQIDTAKAAVDRLYEYATSR